MNSRPRLLDDQRGAAAVEFALILPLLTVLLFAFFEGGRLFYTYNVAAGAARDAARFAARLPMDCNGLSNVGDLARVKSLATTGDTASGSASLVNGITASDVTVTVSCLTNTNYAGIYKDTPQIQTVKVTVKAPFQTLFKSLLPGLKMTSLSAAHSETWTE